MINSFVFFAVGGLSSNDHAFLMGFAGIVCGCLLVYAILSQL